MRVNRLPLAVLGALTGVLLAAPPLGPGPAAAPASTEIVLYAVAEIHGTPEPCGCTSVPLGDVARLAPLLGAQGHSLLLDAGGLRYQEGGVPAGERVQARLKADFLEQALAGLGAVVGLQPEDLAGGVEELGKAQRLAANLRVPGLGLREGVVREVGGVRVGVIGVADPEGAWPAGSKVEEPQAAARRVALALRQQGAELLVALTGLKRPAARRLAQAAPELDVVVVGDQVEDGVPDPELVGRALLVVPAKEARRVVALRFRLGPDGRPVTRWYPGPAWQQRQAERQTQRVRRLAERLDELRRDPGADPAFLRSTEEELGAARRELQALGRDPGPPAGGHVTMELVPVTRRLPRDPALAAAMAALDRRIGEENLKQVKGPPPPPPAGQPAYVGNAGCKGTCHQHDKAHEQWRGTAHVRAWKTLVTSGKQHSYDCVQCHSTGFDAPGGANLWTLNALDRGRKGPADLRAVGCEACHGPGSLHVKSPSQHDIPAPQPAKERCLDCHTKDHSDTFEPAAYLRDVLGPGHGEAARRALGPGPTGAELRREAQAGH